MARTLTVALAQLQPALRDIRANITTMCRVLEAHAAADLVVFPELFAGGYTTIDAGSLAVSVGDHRFATLQATARRLATAVIFGAAVQRTTGVTNSAVTIDSRGRWSKCYDKAYLFADEPRAYLPGDELVITDINGATVGLMICFDVEFPEVARALVRAGADLLVTISANMTPFGPDHRVFGLARAIENGCTHLYVNQVGRGETHSFSGGSMAVSPDGELLVEAGANEAHVITARLEVPARSQIRPNYIAQIRERPPPVRRPPD